MPVITVYNEMMCMCQMVRLNGSCIVRFGMQ